MAMRKWIVSKHAQRDARREGVGIFELPGVAPQR